MLGKNHNYTETSRPHILHITLIMTLNWQKNIIELVPQILQCDVLCSTLLYCTTLKYKGVLVQFILPI